MDITTSHLAERKQLDVIYLDFAKAFDKVSHRLLAHKLSAYGIKGKLLRWVVAFLSDRKQRVILGSSTSKWAPVTSGVPQGSVLGPTLFIIYINDLVDNLKSICKIYADDTKLFGYGDSLQTDLDKISNWARVWLMQLNASKCKVMHIGKTINPKRYTLVDQESGRLDYLEAVNCERDLGVLISFDLKSTAV